MEKTIDDLTEVAKNEKYYNDIQQQIKVLKTQVMHNKEHDLEKFADEIKEALETEIVSRYYFQKGMIESSFDNDPDIQKAVEVLSDTALYAKSLGRKP
ncbi:MAG: hypothetical protein HC842_06675 [Cytophagales bacterium]|nr:hypothetical protein [Cytophagales bacterium]